jgi:hypothetical protein
MIEEGFEDSMLFLAALICWSSEPTQTARFQKLIGRA